MSEVLLGSDVTVWLQVQRRDFRRCPTVTGRFPAKSLLEHFTWQEVTEFQNYFTWKRAHFATMEAVFPMHPFSSLHTNTFTLLKAKLTKSHTGVKVKIWCWNISEVTHTEWIVHQEMSKKYLISIVPKYQKYNLN